MKVFSSSSEFDYSWDEVTIANWQKYSPWNKKTPHVIAVDTLSRRVDSATGILRTERLITCQQSAPKWIQPFLGGSDVSHVYETSYVDPLRKKLTLCSHNLTFSELITVRETVQYSPLLPPGSQRSSEQQQQQQTAAATTGANRTAFTQRAEITALCGGWQKIKNNIEGFLVERFKQNAEKGREGFEMVLKRASEVFREERERIEQQQEQEQEDRRLQFVMEKMKA